MFETQAYMLHFRIELLEERLVTAASWSLVGNHDALTCFSKSARCRVKREQSLGPKRWLYNFSRIYCVSNLLNNIVYLYGSFVPCS
ncbi:hypothetical protein KSS87_019967 [Heliosperma pusillum]|nr:hypothetical protein KSS87_008604 [Heliosperma pusillum]KAH9615796.1 hypothetical protein KSS87_019967 [Heliosperma pusillum]